MANDEFSKFGFYSNSTHNQNKRNTGYNNSLNEGFNFTTTLGANFSTVVGGNFSTTGGVSMSTVVGFNVPVTLFGKIELISPWSIKWTRRIPLTEGPPLPVPAETDVPDWDRRGYDFDFKNCQTQVKWNEGEDIYTFNSSNLREWKVASAGTKANIVLKKDDFAKSANEWIGEKLTVIDNDILTVKSGTMTYGDMTTKVEKDCNISGGSGVSSLSMKASGAKLNSTGVTEINGGTDLKFNCSSKMRFSSAYINIG